MLRSAFVVGASGAVGQQLVDALVSSRQFKKVLVIGRREIPLSHETVEQKVVDFDAIESHAEIFKDIDVGFCALGTTGKEGLYKVDHDYVLNTAKVAKAQGVKEFILVTAMGANEDSRFLYFRTKGEVERDVAALEFDKFLIVRPGILEGPRDERRFTESLVKILVKPLKLFTNSIAISTADVAKAMVVGACSSELKGTVIWDNATLLEKKDSFDNLCE
ncbi:Nucleoside-diphosphate sugar epimerase [Trichostrongylus colubriformis]|uniref:Protein HTATIP2 n=1 Tax=Trichostrongylus colubriformis TaxID=6319 RepID=A0AAN8G9P6_TRICO